MVKESATTQRKRKSLEKVIQIDENVSLFNEVIQEIRSFGSKNLVSGDPHPDEPVKEPTALFADYVTDVASATHSALRGTGRFDDWNSIANDYKWPEAGIRQQIIRLCAPEYRKRGLHHGCHFKKPVPKSVLNTHAKSGGIGGTVVSIAALPAADSHSTGDSAPMLGWIGKAA